ncbi:hypothetical protein C0993_003909 [Termitomyces sp. T159_Od127]|nr:hypothetical protein C0993_003909 [Termitomyces sp. T159_Od127]
MVILNSAQVAREMLETKGLIYSDRPVLQIAGNLVGWRNSLGLMPYGDRFRLYRRLLHDLMGSKASVQKFSDVEQIEMHRFARRVLANPADLAQHIRHTAGAIITRITYGYEVKENDDVFVELANKSVAQFSVATTPGAFVVDVFPQRQLVSLTTLRTDIIFYQPVRHVPAWFPGASFKRKAKEWAATLAEMVEQPFTFVKKELAAGTAQNSFVSSLLAGKDVDHEKEFDIKWSALSLYAGGADTVGAFVIENRSDLHLFQL